MKALVVGYGRMGARHARILRTLGHDVETVDIDPARGADHAALSRGLSADLAAISVPPSALAGVAEQAISWGLAGRLVVDKPMAADLEQAGRLSAEAERAGLDVDVVFTERANPGFRALIDNLHLVGEIRRASVTRLGPPPPNWSCDVGVDLAVHCFDMIAALGVQARPVAVTREPGVARYSCSIDGGGRADVHVSHAAPAHEVRRTFSVSGDGGTLTLDKRSQSVTFATPEGDREVEVMREEPLRIAWSEIVSGTWEADAAAGEAALAMSLAGREPAALSAAA